MQKKNYKVRHVEEFKIKNEKEKNESSINISRIKIVKKNSMPNILR
jgi:hypothetical protein